MRTWPTHMRRMAATGRRSLCNIPLRKTRSPDFKPSQASDARPAPATIPRAYPPWSLQQGQRGTDAALSRGARFLIESVESRVPVAGKETEAADGLPAFIYPPIANACLDSRQALLGKVVSIIGIEQPGSDTDPAVSFSMRCLNGREFLVRVRSMTAFVPLTLFDGEPRGAYYNVAGDAGVSPASSILKLVKQFIQEGLMVMVSGVAFETGRVDASIIYNLYDEMEGPTPHLVFEEPDWWRDQITQLSDSWLRGMFNSADEIDWSLYTTNQGITFGPVEGMMDQEVATLSRLIYGLASAYHLTGNIRFLEAAKSGVLYQRKNFKSPSVDGDTVLWVSARNGRRFKMTSTSGDDAGTIPLYEQIYALAGLAQYYRVTLDPEVLGDIKGTVAAFNKYYKDTSKNKGYFSHIDFATKSPSAASLTYNANKKNWNSIGDHIPAYLINTILALENGGDPEFRETCIDILRETTQLIIDHFVINGLKHVDASTSVTLVPERFTADWQLDTTYSWQQNRGIVGHDLKIVWNLHRVANFLATVDPGLSSAAAEAADSLLKRLIPEGGVDGFRGGCYDCLERKPGADGLSFTWMNTKDFWQQEQAILALLISYGTTGNAKYLDHARAAEAFYNIFFLNRDMESVFFRTNVDGSPVIEGQYGQQASHAKSGYHTHENAFLSFLYNNSYVTKNRFCLYFYPSPNAVGTTLSVMPDFMAPGALKVDRVLAVEDPSRALHPIGDGRDSLLIELPKDIKGTPIQVRFKNPVATASGVSSASSEKQTKGKIGVLIESNYVEAEVQYWQEALSSEGYEVVYLSNLKQWGLTENTFYGNDYRTPVTVKNDLQTYFKEPGSKDTELLHQAGFKGFLLCAGYAMDRLRYDPNRKEGSQPNNSIGVQFLRMIDGDPRFVIGGVCHSLWLYCADPALLKGRNVTCAENVVGDVTNAGGTVTLGVKFCVDESTGKAPLVTGGNLHNVDSSFLSTFLEQLDKVAAAKA